MSLSYVVCRNACTYVSTLKQVPKTVRVKLQINILNDRLVGGAFMVVCSFCLYVISPNKVWACEMQNNVTLELLRSNCKFLILYLVNKKQVVI